MADRQSKNRKTMTANTLIFPEKVVRKILSCLPLKSLLRFRSVSKSWLRFFTLDPSFFKNPSILAILPKSSIRFATDYTACDQTIILKSPFNQDIKHVWGICNGLFCVSLKNRDDEVFIWSPLIDGYYSTIPNSPPTSRFSNDVRYERFYDWGFCYQPDSHEYTVIRVFVEADMGNWDYHSQVSLCTLGNNSIWAWRSIKGDFPYLVGCAAPSPFVNGAFHWLASRSLKGEAFRRRASRRLKGEAFDFIVAFDINDETFREIQPPDDAIFKTHIIDHRVTDMNGMLCMFSLHRREKVQIWIMTQYGVISSWTKQFNIGVTQIFGSFRDLVPLGVADTGEIILKKDRELVLYNRESYSINNLGEFDLGEFGIHAKTYVYTASILSPRFLQDAPHIQT